MRTLKILTGLAVVGVVLAGASAFVVMAFAPPTVMVAALPDAPKAVPGVQASRAALPAEKARTAALVETDQAMKDAATAVDDVTPQAAHGEGHHARANRGGERYQRDVRRRTDGYTAQARWSSNLPRLHGPE